VAVEQDLVRAVLANEPLIAITVDDRAARTGALDRAQNLLALLECRIVRIESRDGAPLDLRDAMNQIIGNGPNNAERVEHFFDAIARRVAGERHTVLMIDDAQRLAPDLLNYLALVNRTIGGQEKPMQIVFAGDTSLWDRLPASGNLAPDNIHVRITAAPLGQTSPADPPRAAPPEPVPEPATGTEPAVEGHELLRQTLVQQEMNRQRKLEERLQMQQQAQSRMSRLVPITVLAISCMVTGTVLWTSLPQLRAVVKGITAPQPVSDASDDQSPAALLARGSKFLAEGDIMAAQVLFAHAASAGSAQAATSLAKTYDPVFLAEIHAQDVSPDPAIAAAWYLRAAAMGDTEAPGRLSRMQAQASQ
jgi:hypothetical protein